jgi:hypothetical protein
MTTDDERLLQLIRLDRWLQRRNPRRLWAETIALAIGFACLSDLLAVLSLAWFPPDPACPIVYGSAGCLDTTGNEAVTLRSRMVGCTSLATTAPLRSRLGMG